ncbi:unnamed protein product (macronuclear) [Paramecium tetraurelia]|uniref:Chromosome undetermined scaffold_1, whole genome shotgun sequence n=1 Tax=Paramecium tetraurelia TaxID=5888 RepID=Q6BFQ7_PARTE|nr:hypothetical protein [Paramecium tetraurelia strain d4-2]XP_001423146.1 uncharacterized protein GSPATT00000183001 [Paramecium tetraurelia]CAH03513.1 hypothetical protein, transmembrane helices [Paramecium tetraurelia]CAK55748.1 unnamed protein product [Paramecium tetraurelia]|eukprot:XP_001423146.1 hypothetical protein (macronuclear) [Paramecium tetraurelia strain d4-2]
MIIEANSLADELKGVSRYEKVAYISIFMIGLLVIKTDDAYITCQTSTEFQGIIWEMGLIPLAFLGDVTKNLNINIFVVGLVQFLVCQLRLQFTMIYLLYKILGQGKMTYSLLYLIPLITNTILPHQKVLFGFAQFVLVLLIIMLNKTLMQEKQHKQKINFKFYASRLTACIILMQKLDMVNSNFYENQVILMGIFLFIQIVLSLPIVKILSDRVPDITFAFIFLIYFYLSHSYLFIQNILQGLLICFVVVKLLPIIMDQKFSCIFYDKILIVTISLLLPIIILQFPLPEYFFVLLIFLMISEPPQNLYEQIEL